MAAFCLAVLSLTGCQSDGEPIYSFSGRVVFEDGSPAQFGIIEFRSDAAEPVTARGKINKDGTFRVRASERNFGLTEGTHRAIIIQVVGNPRGRPKIAHSHGLEVADKYRKYETSDLQVQISRDSENEFEFVVESK